MMKENLFFDIKKRVCPFSKKNSPKIDYKDVKLLSRYITEKGKIIPGRVTNVSRRNQNKVITSNKKG